MIVSVFGAAFLGEDGPAYAFARAVGAEVARAGAIVMTGGFGGAMAAASRGAAEAGGHTIGVTCEPLLRAGRQINRWVKEEVRCSTARDRLFTLLERADACIALDGGIGTLTEIAFGWNQIQLGEIPPRPIILCGNVWRETFAAFFRTAGGYIKEEERALLKFADTPQEAVGLLGMLRRRS